MLDKSETQTTSSNKRRCCITQPIEPFYCIFCKNSTLVEWKPTWKSIHIYIVMILSFIFMSAVLSNSAIASMRMIPKKVTPISLAPTIATQDSIDLIIVEETVKIYKFYPTPESNKVFDISRSPRFSEIYKISEISKSSDDTISTALQELNQDSQSYVVESENALEYVHVQNDWSIPSKLYLHIDPTSQLYWIPKVEEGMISDDDRIVDLTELFNSDYAYSTSDDLAMVIARIVHRESANQPFIGQVLVAEDVRDRLASGVYGNDIAAILHSGYETVADENGNIHVYNAQGKEVLVPNESAVEATKIALQGSQLSHLLLKESTEIFVEHYGVELDNKELYYMYTFYHYAPSGLTDKQLANRSIERVPVAIEVYDHVFYGHWLSASQALSF